MHTIYVAKGDNNAQLLKYSIKSSLLTIILATIKSNTCNNIRQDLGKLSQFLTLNLE